MQNKEPKFRDMLEKRVYFFALEVINFLEHIINEANSDAQFFFIDNLNLMYYKSIDKLIKKHKLEIIYEIEGHYQFASEREQVNTNKSQVLQNQINFLLEETNAYRKYLNRIEFDILKSGI